MTHIKSKKYSVRVRCINCRNKERISVPKGKYIKDFIIGCVCSKCNTKSLVMMLNQLGDENDFFEESFFGLFDDPVPREIEVKDTKHSKMVELKIKVPVTYVEEINKLIIELLNEKDKKKKK